MQQVGAETRHHYYERWEQNVAAKDKPVVQQEPVGVTPAGQEVPPEALATKDDLVPATWRDRLPAAVAKSEKVMRVVEALVAEAEAADIQTRILESIIDAEEVEQMVPGGGIPSIENICKQNVPYENSPEYIVFGFSVNKSNVPEGEGLPVYLVFDVVNTETGDREVIGTGAVQTVISFWRIRDKGRLPVAVRWYISRKETDAGWRPLNFELTNATPLGPQKVRAEIVPPAGSVPHESGWQAPAAS